MSSLAASRADNFYFPPDWRPEYGGISKFQGSKGANQYQQYGIIRFELPFDGWCLKCERHISKGTRFNAKKDADGHYFTTKIWAFTMKCASCDNPIIIKTNPKDRTYDFFQGIRKMEQDFIPEFNDSIIASTTDEERIKLASNPIYKLEHHVEGQIKIKSANERINDIIDIKDEQFGQDYSSNSHLRKLLRTKKQKDKKMLKMGQKIGFANIPLLDSHPEDYGKAQHAMNMIKYSDNIDVINQRQQHPNTKEQLNIQRIQNESIFNEKYIITKTHSKKRKTNTNDLSNTTHHNKSEINNVIMSNNNQFDKNFHKDSKSSISKINKKMHTNNNNNNNSNISNTNKLSNILIKRKVDASDIVIPSHKHTTDSSSVNRNTIISNKSNNMNNDVDTRISNNNSSNITSLSLLCQYDSD